MPKGTENPEGMLDLAQTTVCVLGGGRSSEREISLRTQATVVEALASPTLSVRPGRVIATEVLPDGKWLVDGRARFPGPALSALEEVDVFFLALHGGEGEDGTLQGLLEANDRAYTGSGVGSSAVAMDKCFARTLVESAGLRTPPGRSISGATWRSNPDGELEALASLAADQAGKAWFVKPRSGGSSVATTWLRGKSALETDLEGALLAVFEEGDEALVELAIEGVEVSVGVLNEPSPRGSAGRPRALTPIEIQPHAERFFDYREKYQADGALEFCPPRSLTPAVQAELMDLALLVHTTLRCSGFSRADFIVPPSGPPVFLETNTLPGLMERSLLPQEAAEAGIDYPTLCQWILLDALAVRRQPKLRTQP